MKMAAPFRAARRQGVSHERRSALEGGVEIWRGAQEGCNFGRAAGRGRGLADLKPKQQQRLRFAHSVRSGDASGGSAGGNPGYAGTKPASTPEPKVKREERASNENRNAGGAARRYRSDASARSAREIEERAACRRRAQLI